MLGAALLGVWLLLRIGPPAVRAVGEARALLQAQREQLARLRRELAGLTELADSAARVEAKVVALAPRILAGPTGAQAGDDLGGRVALAVRRSQGRLLATEVVADSARAGGLRRAALRLTAEGDGRVVVALLQALEQDAVALGLEDLRVLALDPGHPVTEPERLRLELTVRGWYQAREPAP